MNRALGEYWRKENRRSLNRELRDQRVSDRDLANIASLQFGEELLAAS